MPKGKGTYGKRRGRPKKKKRKKKIDSKKVFSGAEARARGRDIGRFDAIVDGVRFSAKEMNAAAWGIYMDIIDPGKKVDDIRKLFMEDRDVKNLMLGKFQVEGINEDEARAAAFAMRYLVDRFLGREVTASSGNCTEAINGPKYLLHSNRVGCDCICYVISIFSFSSPL